MEIAYTEVPFDELSTPELEIIFKNVSNIKRFLEKVEARVFGLAMKGKKFDDYKIVKSYGKTTCIDQEGLVQVAREDHDCETEDLYNIKLKSKTDLKRILPDDLIKKHFVSPEPGRKLVQMHDNSPAVRIQGDFSAFDNFKTGTK